MNTREYYKRRSVELTFQGQSTRGMQRCSVRPWKRRRRPWLSCRCYRPHWLVASDRRSPVLDVGTPGLVQTHTDWSPGQPAASTSAPTGHTITAHN